MSPLTALRENHGHPAIGPIETDPWGVRAGRQPQEEVDVMIKALVTVLVLTAGLLIGAATANAKKPLDVDCDLLADTNDAVNDFLDAEGIQFRNLGQLISSSILDEAVFDQLNALTELFSGGEISFDSPSQAVSTNAKCGLIPQLIDNIRD